MKTIIISDLHLGAKNSQTSKIQSILSTSFDRLILNGDTIDNLNFKKFRQPHWEVLAHLEKIAKTKSLILVKGNHDEQTKKGGIKNQFDILPKIIGSKFVDEFSIEVGSKKYLILHGHMFDPTLNFPIITDAADWCYQTAQKINKQAAKWLKKKVKHVGGVIEFVRQQSTKYAAKNGYDGIITGHTHYHEDEIINDVRFVNCGFWVEDPCHFVSVDNSVVTLNEW